MNYQKQLLQYQSYLIYLMINYFNDEESNSGFWKIQEEIKSTKMFQIERLYFHYHLGIQSD